MENNLLLEWYEIRDLFLGCNEVGQNLTHALELAVDCPHNEARWLTHMFEGKNVTTQKEAVAVLLSLRNDARALCFAALLASPIHDALLRQSAERGYAFAQGKMAMRGSGAERHFWALRASLQEEREGFCWLGVCLRDGEGCDRDTGLAKELFFRAAKLRCVASMLAAADLMSDSEPKRWKWLGRVAVKGTQFPFFESFSFVVSSFKRDPSLRGAVFAIGRALDGHVSSSRREIFMDSCEFDKRIGHATEAVNFFRAQCRAARSAISTWTLIARRLVVFFPREIRLMVSEMIWKARKEANYLVGNVSSTIRAECWICVLFGFF